MTTKVDDSQLINITQVEECIKVGNYIKFKGTSRKEKYQWLEKIIRRFNYFYEEHLNPYLNYHRPCGFPTVISDRRGKERKVYRTYVTPYDKLHSLGNAAQYLKSEVIFAQLDAISKEKSDNECVTLMQKAKVELFKNFHETIQLPKTYMALISGSSLD